MTDKTTSSRRNGSDFPVGGRGGGNLFLEGEGARLTSPPKFRPLRFSANNIT
jgi:hypothetical protein